MEVVFNGKRVEVDPGITVEKLLESQGYKTKFVVVEVDGDVVNHHKYAETIVEEESEIDADYLVGGG